MKIGFQNIYIISKTKLNWKIRKWWAVY